MTQSPPSLMTLGELQERLRHYHQEHLLAYWPRLAPDQQSRLFEQLQAINLELVAELFQKKSADGQKDWAALAARATAPPAIRLPRSQPGSESEVPLYPAAQAQRVGEEMLTSGKVGVVLVAGGQATRLGYDQPKGVYPIGPISQASLFQILIEMLLATRQRYGAKIPLFLMTSPATDEPTHRYLEQQSRFGLAEEDLFIFCQGTMPAVDRGTGGILLAAPDQVALSPDGHGGVLEALARAGLFEEMRQRGIEELFYLQVDNPLARLCEPAFLGYHLLSGAQVSTKVIAKTSPTEKLGNLAMIDGRMSVIEYSDLPDEHADRRNEAGEPIFWAGNLAVHVFNRDFLVSLAEGDHQLEFHQALKKVPYVNQGGQRIEPTEPNAIKFERFIFDVLPQAETAIVVEADRQGEYAGVKNATGANSPESVRAQMAAEHRKWLREAGLNVADDVTVEVSPLYALDPHQLRQRLTAEGRTGETIQQATYFQPSSEPCGPG